MSAVEWILIGSSGGALGAWLRTVLRDECVAKGIAPWHALLSINIIGSALAGWVSASAHDEWLRVLVLTGFLGGLTTLSGMCLDTFVQWRSGRRWTAAGIAIGTLVGGPIACGVAAVAGAPISPTMGATACAAIAPTAGSLRGRRLAHHGGGLALIALGGAAGSSLRITADLLGHANQLAPWLSTAAVNMCGSLLAGWAYQWLSAIDHLGRPRHAHSKRLRLERLLIFGFAGGLTTMSALAVEVLSAWDQDPFEALMIASVNGVLGLAAVIVGWNLAVRLRPVSS